VDEPLEAERIVTVLRLGSHDESSSGQILA